ncbi:MAG: hypothetical protein JJU33_14010 [Phycisphaerales bacterium]|nr:hypothetical protein [Phycisphaerales bacterium]
MRLFLTVGTQLSFERLTGGVDRWAGACDVRPQVSAQAGPDEHRYEHLEVEPFVSPSRFNELFEQADAVVGHAGMGTILTAMTRGKPLLIMPRKASLGEQRNDHQLATAKHFEGRPGILVAWEEEDLAERLDELVGLASAPPSEAAASPWASERLLDFVRSFVRG